MATSTIKKLELGNGNYTWQGVFSKVAYGGCRGTIPFNNAKDKNISITYCHVYKGSTDTDLLSTVSIQQKTALGFTIATSDNTVEGNDFAVNFTVS